MSKTLEHSNSDSLKRTDPWRTTLSSFIPPRTPWNKIHTFVFSEECSSFRNRWMQAVTAGGRFRLSLCFSWQGAQVLSAAGVQLRFHCFQGNWPALRFHRPVRFGVLAELLLLPSRLAPDLQRDLLGFPRSQCYYFMHGCLLVGEW